VIFRSPFPSIYVSPYSRSKADACTTSLRHPFSSPNHFIPTSSHSRRKSSESSVTLRPIRRDTLRYLHTASPATILGIRPTGFKPTTTCSLSPFYSFLQPRSTCKRELLSAHLTVELGLISSTTAMAANDYYRDTSSRYNTHTNYEPSIAPSTNPPPSYHTHQPWQHGQTEAPPTSTSPFETVFDDHVYPTQSHPTLNSVSTSQQSFAHDTRYHGAASPEASPVVTDEIPLQQHNKLPGGYLNDSNDHVYDADPAPRSRGPIGGGRLGFGQLGMLGTNKRRIPIIVYLFTTIQVAVFIYELVKAGV